MDQHLSVFLAEAYAKLEKMQDSAMIARTLYNVLEKHFTPHAIWQLSRFFEKLTEKDYQAYPALTRAFAILAASTGALDFAQRLTSLLEEGSTDRLLADIMLPTLSEQQYEQTVRSLAERSAPPVLNLSLTAGRPSVINGYRDFTILGDRLDTEKETMLQGLRQLYGENEELIYDIAMAERDYQRDNCYDALVKVVALLPFLQAKNDAHTLFAALFLEIEIMVMNGQSRTAIPLMDNMRKQMYRDGYEACLPNLDASVAWAAMYDGDYLKVAKWLRESAPDEHTEFCMLDLFCYVVKMRAYLIYGKHLAINALAHKLLPLLERGNRMMDTCEVYILLALSDHARGDVEKALDHLEQALILAEQYRYDRLLADEGKRIYELLYVYKKARGKNEYAEYVRNLAQKVMLLYPRYLKEQLPEMPALSPAEMKTLRLMADEQSNAEIAGLLHISLNTVKFHGKNIFEKLRVRSRAQAVRKARELGILD